MNQRFWFFVGFANTIVFPVVSVLLGTIILASSGLSPALPLVVAIFPLGLSSLVFFPLGLRPGGRPTLQDYVSYVAGARYGIMSSVIVVIPAALVWGIDYKHSVLGEALIIATIGSFLLPSVSLSGIQGYLLAKQIDLDRFFDKAKLSPTNSENVAILLLGLFLQIPGFMRRTWRVAMAQLIFTLLYFVSWIILGFAGGFPYTLVGLILGFLVPLSAFVSYKRLLVPEERTKLSEVLIERTSSLPRAGTPTESANRAR
jgi:hypothetical protein